VFAEGLQSEARETCDQTFGQGFLKGGRNWAEKGTVREVHKLGNLGWKESGIGFMDNRSGTGWRRQRWKDLGNGLINVPEVVGAGAAVASQDCDVIMFNFHVVLGECGCAIGVTELADGQERRVEVFEDMGLCGCRGKMGNWESAYSVGCDGSSIGKEN
jgi:hypothetical protein